MNLHIDETWSLRCDVWRTIILSMKVFCCMNLSFVTGKVETWPIIEVTHNTQKYQSIQNKSQVITKKVYHVYWEIYYQKIRL